VKLVASLRSETMGLDRSPAPDQARARRAALVRLGLLVGVLATVFVTALALGVDVSPERIRRDVAGLGALAPLLYVPLAVALMCLGAPSPAVVGAAGLLFGPLLGGAVGHAGVVAVAVTQLLITRYLARDQARALLPARAHRFDDFLERRGFFAVLYLRMVPGLPFGTLNYAAGLTRLKAWHIGAGTALGMAPRSFAYAALGGSLGDPTSPIVLVAVGVSLVMAIAGGLLAWRQARSERAAAT
jgi:uncharacterized membrane protein YdjX (TVP38/TMEM64 family)